MGKKIRYTVKKKNRFSLFFNFSTQTHSFVLYNLKEGGRVE